MAKISLTLGLLLSGMLLAVACSTDGAPTVVPSQTVQTLNSGSHYEPQIDDTIRRADIIAIGTFTGVAAGVYRESSSYYVPTRDYSFNLHQVIKGDNRDSIVVRVAQDVRWPDDDPRSGLLVPSYRPGFTNEREAWAYAYTKISDSSADMEDPGGLLDSGKSLLFIKDLGEHFTFVHDTYEELARPEPYGNNIFRQQLRSWLPLASPSGASGSGDDEFYVKNRGNMSLPKTQRMDPPVTTVSNIRALVQE